MSLVVVDASVAIKWVIAEAGSEQAMSLRSQHDFLAPELLLVETANILWKKVQRKELSSAEATAAHAILMMAGIEVVSMRDLISETLRLSIALQHPAYDCVYLALAVGHDVPLVTADRRLAERATARIIESVPQIVLIA